MRCARQKEERATHTTRTWRGTYGQVDAYAAGPFLVAALRVARKKDDVMEGVAASIRWRLYLAGRNRRVGGAVTAPTLPRQQYLPRRAHHDALAAAPRQH